MNTGKNVGQLKKLRQRFRPRETPHAALQQGVDAFLEDLKRRKLNPQSIHKRRGDLRGFTYYLETHGIARFQDVTRRTLDLFRLWLLESGYSDSMQESCMRAVQLMFRLLAARGELFEDPAATVEIPKAPLRMGTVLSVREMRRLLSMPDLTTLQGVRDRAMMELLYSTGMRRGELMGLKVFDVNLDNATTRVHGKFDKERILPLGKQAVRYVRLYLTDVRPKLQPLLSRQHEDLWLSRNRRLIGEALPAVRIAGYVKAAGIAKPVDAHTFRRTCATHLLLGGAHPVAVAQLLGHADLESLSHYLRTTVGDLKRAHAQTNPGK